MSSFYFRCWLDVLRWKTFAFSSVHFSPIVLFVQKKRKKTGFMEEQIISVIHWGREYSIQAWINELNSVFAVFFPFAFFPHLKNYIFIYSAMDYYLCASTSILGVEIGRKNSNVMERCWVVTPWAQKKRTYFVESVNAVTWDGFTKSFYSSAWLSEYTHSEQILELSIVSEIRNSIRNCEHQQNTATKWLRSLTSQFTFYTTAP